MNEETTCHSRRMFGFMVPWNQNWKHFYGKWVKKKKKNLGESIADFISREQ